MASVGFTDAKIAVLDENEAVIGTPLIVDKQDGGAMEANITGLGANRNVVYASNVPFYVSAQGTGEPQLEFSVADLSDDILEQVLGEVTNEQGISLVGQDTKPPFVAVILHSADKDGNDLYFGLLKGKFAYPDNDLKSNDNSGATLQTDKITGSFVARGLDGYVQARGRSNRPVFTYATFEQFVFHQASATTTTTSIG
jgi:phi13 family phage major tail protein